MTRNRALAMLAVSLVLLLGGALAVGAAEPGNGPATAQPAPTPPAPNPLAPVPTSDPCTQDSPLPVCHLPAPTPTPPSTGVPLPIPTGPPTSVTCFPGSLQYECLNQSTPSAPPPCTGEGCIPQPPSSTAPPTDPGSRQPGQPGEDDDECGITDIGACITEAINAFFRGIVEAALNPLLDLLSRTLLTTPTPDSLPRIGELWNNSWQILLACYGLLILIAGVLIMGYETLQTRHSVKEIAPRLVVGFLAGALSLWVATKAIQIANGLAQAVMGGGVDASSAGTTLRNLVLGSLNGGIWIIFLGIFLAGMLIVLLVTYIVRVALTVILVAGAPVALMFHALPQTEGIARWWWKAFGGCLAIQVCQSLTLITAMNVFLAPGGFSMFGPTVSGLVNLLVALALMYILFKIPFWVLASVRTGSGRSLLGTVVRGFVAYKTFGLFRGRGGGATGRPRPSGGSGRAGNSGGRAPADPYVRTRATADGQYVLPLTGVRRHRPAAKPKPAPAPKSGAGQGRQLALPLGDDWPEHKPVLGRDGQYRLPLEVERVTSTPSPAASDQPGTGDRPRGRSGGGRQLELPFDPYKGNRATRSGQYPLPLDGVRRTPRPPSPPPPAAPPPPRTRATQPELPFDPYKGNRATRSGQYPLPLDGVRRVAPAKPAPAPPPARPVPPAGQQLRLPLDLPKPPRRTRPPKPGGMS
ncbi:Cell surface antigen I/II [Kibdelosporangium sp. 4NS15]|uniref:Cell surface antigen I/II n=1 Tax=Kibdelosporangium persicum TaxID=2698649 RepID=A0ABX2F4I4_9PSEU|nr:hypothetical protein [Kibdelosporangium persicum]NRN65730.1 Cell surface antigen I/II [Kibdelosporangium persicum]